MENIRQAGIINFFIHPVPIHNLVDFLHIGKFCKKGCQVVKTPINTRVATSKRLSEVVIRLSGFWWIVDSGWWMVDSGWWTVNGYCFLGNTHAF